MAVWLVAVMTKVIGGIHMTWKDGSRGSGSDDKRDLWHKWHMHMTRTDGKNPSVTNLYDKTPVSPAYVTRPPD